MTYTLTTERLREIASRPSFSASPLSHEVKYMARELLANREAQPVFCVDMDSNFIKHIQKCSEEVAKWPEWKQRGSDVTQFAAPPAPAYPETLPCPVRLMPGLLFGRGVTTKSMLDALVRRAEYEAELDAMTPEKKAEDNARIEAFKALLPKPPAPAVPDGHCIMPLTLTAANGAKGALSGEFKVSRTVRCHECGGEGCDDCGDAGEFEEEITVPWDTIKEIYRAAVDACRAAMLTQPVSQGNEWIACSERLPKVGGTVLISSDGYVSVGEMNRSGANYRYFTSVATGRELTVTHWMPLPAAPEGGNNIE